MHNNFLGFFPAAEREKIASAVREAERVTSGEIVPYVVRQSDHYEAAEWRGGFIAWAVALAAVTIFRNAAGEWTSFDPVVLAASTLLAGGAGMLAVRFVPTLKRLLAGRRLITRRVEQRAAEAFVSEEVFATSGRTGILIFLSMLERRVLILGDAGIHRRVRQEDWHGIIGLVIEAIRAGRPGDGLIEAIRRCGDLLAAHGVAPSRRNPDELPDNLRIRKE